VGTSNAGFARARFSTDAVRPADRFEHYCDVIGRTAAKCEIQPLDDQFRCVTSMYVMPELRMARIAASPVRVSLTRQMVSNLAPDYGLILYRKGISRVSQLGREMTIAGPGALLMSAAHPMVLERSFCDFTGITIPRAALAPMVRNIDDAVMSLIPSDIEAMRLLSGYLDLLVKDTPIVTPDVRRLAACHVHDLLAVALGATRDAAEVAKGRGVRVARLSAVKSDIMVNLARPDLGVGAVAVRQGISESYIRKLFETEGTSFSDFVLEQRLARAYRLLTDPRLAARSITSIAFDAGFGDLSYFNRCFRRRYGATPSDVRSSAQD
jgi:AraC-like DNA-binding protein